jgi:hypothetical protein
VTDTAIQHMLQQEIASNSAFPARPARYFVYLPPGVKVVQGGTSCRAFCGYHNDISGQVFYGVLPYPGLRRLHRGPRGLRCPDVHQLTRAL